MAGLEPSWNGDVALATLQPASSFPELYYPIWLYSGSNTSFPNTSDGVYFMQKGNTSSLNSISSSAIKLFTMPTGWKSTTPIALEASLMAYSSSRSTQISLWDVTSNALVTGSTTSTTATTYTVLRSGTFNLIGGHTYAVTGSNPSSSVYVGGVTDASLIVFPSSPLTSPSVSAISLANPSGNTLKEAYIPLWVYSSGTASTTANSSTLNMIAKGSTGIVSTSAVNAVLHTLSSSWNPNQKFALEASIYGSVSGPTYEAFLIDLTTGASTSHSVTTTTTTSTLLRSSSFTLTPGHEYGVSICTQFSTGSGTTYLTKAHLVALA